MPSQVIKVLLTNVQDADSILEEGAGDINNNSKDKMMSQ